MSLVLVLLMQESMMRASLLLGSAGAARSASAAADVYEWPLVVKRIAASDERAFECLFNTLYADLCAFTASYIRETETAEEIVQNVFLRVWERRHTWDPQGGVRAYLFAACRNAAFDQLRHEQTVERADASARAAQALVGLGVAPTAPDAAAEAAELGDAIRLVVAQMPERRRVVMTLRWQYQLGPAEIARVLGITVKGVEAHYARALKELRERMARFRP